MKILTGKEFARLLEKRGWVLTRVRGSHHVYMKPGLPTRISVPVHGNQSLKKGLQQFFMKVAGIRKADL